MTALESTIRLVADALRELERRWALVGGLAVSARAEPRFTRDIDLAVVVEDDADAERLVHAMLQRGFETLATVEQKSVGRLATIRLTAPSADKRRPQDAADLRALLAEAEQGDLALAENALTLITERGFARGRDLMAAWRTLRDEQA